MNYPLSIISYPFKKIILTGDTLAHLGQRTL